MSPIPCWPPQNHQAQHIESRAPLSSPVSGCRRQLCSAPSPRPTSRWCCAPPSNDASSTLRGMTPSAPSGAPATRDRSGSRSSATSLAHVPTAASAATSPPPPLSPPSLPPPPPVGVMSRHATSAGSVVDAATRKPPASMASSVSAPPPVDTSSCVGLAAARWTLRPASGAHSASTRAPLASMSRAPAAVTCSSASCSVLAHSSVWRPASKPGSSTSPSSSSASIARICLRLIWF